MPGKTPHKHFGTTHSSKTISDLYQPINLNELSDVSYQFPKKHSTQPIYTAVNLLK